jgi:hypothetical protein
MAQSFGYNVKVHCGYKFDKTENVFTDFVNKYYSIKSGLSDIQMDRTTAKLLLNSLYGRLGLNQHSDTIRIVDSKQAEFILSRYVVKEQYSLAHNLELIRFENKPVNGFEELFGEDEYSKFLLECDSKNISTTQSLPCAIAITAYSRMYMFSIIYKLIDLGIKIYYMDTDSIVTDRPIPSHLIGNELGLFKLEHIIKHGYFIAPKLYALITSDNKTIIKAKGIGNNLTINDFENLITNKSLIKAQDRWFKDVSNANIDIKNMNISVNPTSFKRKTIIENNRLRYTIPFTINNNSIIDS